MICTVKKTAKKRLGSEYELSLDELYDCASNRDEPEKETDAKLLSNVINSWIGSLPDETRNIFICRYFYFDSIRDIAAYTGSSESKVKSALHRARLSLRKHLEKEELI